MSYQIDYNVSKDATTGLDFGTRDGTINMKQIISLNHSKPHAYRVARAILSNLIPNFYNYGNFNNLTFRISTDGGTNWVDCTLKNGIYTLKQIQQAFNDVFIQEDWLLSSTSPAVIIDVNPTTQIIYVKTDSTKLKAGQVGIDFTVSSMYDTFGLTVAQGKIITDTMIVASNSPKMDAQGSYIDVYMTLIQSCRYVNGQISSTICRLPLQATGNEIIYPSANTGSVSPIVKATIPSEISTFSVRFVNSYGRPAVFLMGNAIIELELIEL